AQQRGDATLERGGSAWAAHSSGSGRRGPRVRRVGVGGTQQRVDGTLRDRAGEEWASNGDERVRTGPRIENRRKPIRLFGFERMRRQFLNLVVESLDTGLHSLRRINLSSNLFYPSSTAAEAAMARSEAAIKANAEKQAGYRHGFRFLQTIASSLGPLPDAVINLKPSVWSADHMPFDMISLLSDESTILWSDSAGCTSLYDVDSNSAMPVPNLRAPKGRGTIPITITRAATNGSLATQRESLYVMGRWLHPNFRDYCFEKLSYEGGQDVFSEHDLSQGWCCVPPPPACELPDYIDAYTVVGGSTIYFSSTKPGVGTYAFDTGSWKWRLAGNWNLPFSGKAEYVPELKLWFGLSTCSPFHLCASDLSAVHFERPPTVDHTWVDLDIPKSWSLFHLDIINLGSGRFCVVKIFHNTVPSLKMGFSDDEGSDNDEALDCGDVINSEFAILTGIEIVGCGGEAPPGKLRMLKHMSKYYLFEDYCIRRG
ncbi:hypothetical protein U9M48_004266, partial [Paspalum notatum var. saurae]